MILLAAAGLGLLIGVILGGLGGGGAILTFPALVYLLGQNPQPATTSSLIVVGLTAVVGAASHVRTGNIRWRTGLTFGITGTVAAVAGTIANRHVPARILLLAFAALMITAAIGMLTHRACRPHTPAQEPSGSRRSVSQVDVAEAETPARTATTVKAVAAGLAVGFLTGFLGVGGGFVIVPALVLVLDLPMNAAVGTSLVVIAINSGASLAGRSGQGHVEWAITAPLALAAMAASLVGKKIATRIPEAVAMRAFAVLVLAVAVYTIAHTLISP
ncbi:sulfite exporter TauE/SafE family protein [Micromonospora sp. ANENR4]|uniref:sulfite exporter TauE/SafE family protein n=1 Tax=Micromonospora TaxID=1873 RepID=UPI00188EEB9B|nr:sulfite exporter TauE/SafE family protein [Micromonospora sp. ANENR4]MBF5034043.1 sulfite exporter TauE/SafE family protein [Micromonospora sp. ANENR4]